LDEDAIAALAAAPVNNYGVGTSLVTGSGFPTAGFVFKMVAKLDGKSWVNVSKQSAGKSNIPGRKIATRVSENGVAVQDRISTDKAPTGRQLQVAFISNGQIIYKPDLAAARDRFAKSLSELPATAKRLSDGEPALAVATS
jgi:nicotinate phosphoribosyltransferase